MEAESRTAEKLTAKNGQQGRSTIQLVRDIATDTSTLVRKEIELARQELTEVLKARLLGGAALAVGGAMAVFGLIYLGIAAGSALSIVLPRWLAWLIVGGAFLVLAGGAALIGLADGGDLLFAQHPSLGKDMNTLLKQVFEKLGGKGGGARDFARGKLANASQVESALALAGEKLSGA